jgi:hypothetical protein
MLESGNCHVLTWASAGFVRLKYRGYVRYFFDTRDDETFIRDDVGVELSDFEAATDLAALSLAELAKDVLPGTTTRVIAVEVRDASRAVLKEVMTFEAVLLAD